MKPQNSLDADRIEERLDLIVRGIERVGLGHLPFREGLANREIDHS